MDLNKIRNLVEIDRRELLMRFPFFGRIICSTELVIVSSDDLNMASTDYRHIFLSAANYPELPEETRLAVLAHEVLHIALRHAFRIGSRERKRFEQAADIEVENLMPQSLLSPYFIPNSSDWKELTAEEIYELLPDSHWSKEEPWSEHCLPGDATDGSEDLSVEEQSSQEPQEKSTDGGEERNAAKSSAEDAPRTEESRDSSGEGSAPESSDEAADEEVGTGGAGKTVESHDEPNSGTQSALEEPGISIGDFAPRFEKTAEAHSRMLYEELKMDMALRPDSDLAIQALKTRLAKIKPGKIKWRTLLRQFLRVCRGGAYTWNVPNRRFIGRGLYLPGRQSKRFCGVVALDVSGSMDWNLPQIFGELVSLLRSFDRYSLDVLQCDTEITDAQHFDDQHPFVYEKLKLVQGSGWNRFNPVFDYIRQHQIRPNVLIYLTDGYLFTADKKSPPGHGPSYPVLWMLTKDGVPPVKWGKAIYFEEEK